MNSSSVKIITTLQAKRTPLYQKPSNFSVQVKNIVYPKISFESSKIEVIRAKGFLFVY